MVANALPWRYLCSRTGCPGLEAGLCGHVQPFFFEVRHPGDAASLLEKNGQDVSMRRRVSRRSIMLGAIIGDMVGSPYEFHPWQGAAEAFPLFSPCSRFTDDTVMTVAVARGLMQAYGQEQACREAFIDAMHEYGRAYSRAGYGQRFSAGSSQAAVSRTTVSATVRPCVSRPWAGPVTVWKKRSVMRP